MLSSLFSLFFFFFFFFFCLLAFLQLAKYHKVMLRHFLRREEAGDPGVPEDEVPEDDDSLWTNGIKSCWLQPQRVIAMSEVEAPEPGAAPLPVYLIKWEDLGYEQCTWEYASDIPDHVHLIDEYKQREEQTKGIHIEKEKKGKRKEKDMRMRSFPAFLFLFSLFLRLSLFSPVLSAGGSSEEIGQKREPKTRSSRQI